MILTDIDILELVSSGKLITDGILADIDKLDAKLSKVDKYYVKTKSKKEELLSDTTSERYSEATDYFETLEKIKADFNLLFKKYSDVLYLVEFA